MQLPEMAILHSFPAHYDFSSATEKKSAVLPHGWNCVNASSIGGTAAEAERPLVVNLQAAVHKVNGHWLKLLRQIAANVGRPVILRFFPNLRLRQYSAATAGALLPLPCRLPLLLEC